MTVPFQFLPVESIELDLKNPRIAKWIEIYSEPPTYEQISLALGAGGSEDGVGGPSYNTLKQSIQTNGGIIHPIIVNKKSSGKLVVIEGNTRVQIYRELKEQKVKGNWDKIPAIVHNDLTEKVIDSIRLQAHLVGVRQWDPYSKAKYLEMLRNKEHLTFSQIVDFCGGNKREIENYINAYNDMEKYYRDILESDSEFDPTRFSSFVELQAGRVREAIVREGFTKTDFSKWVEDRKLYPQATVRKLPRILQNDKSREVFLRSGAIEALKVLDIPDTSEAMKDATLEQLAREIARRISGIEYSEIRRLRGELYSEERDNLCDARDALMELCDDIIIEEA